MDQTQFSLLAAGAVAGGFVNGLAGFGTALFALGFFLNVLPPLQAVAVVVVMSVVSGLHGLWVVRREILDNPARFARLVVPALIGIPLGVQTLAIIDADMLKMVIACFLILYGGYFSLRRNLPVFEKPTHLIDGIVGFLGGLLGGAASLSGALPTMWCSMKPWSKTETRAVLQPFNVIVLGITAVILFYRGAFTPDAMTALTITVPVGIVASLIGIVVFKALTTETFRRLLIIMTFLSGAILLVREALAFGM